MSQISILVVDDYADNFDVIETALLDPKYQLSYVDSGQEALDSLDLFHPDVILLDVRMPGMDGFEVCQRIRDLPQWQQTPIIMVTALTDKKELARCLEVGADDFVSKPINHQELNARVNSMLRIKQHHSSLRTLLKFREDMMYMLVHDLRNCLTEILLALEFLKFKHQALDREEITQIKSSAKTLQDLSDDLLKVALLKSNKIRLTFTKVDVSQLIQSVVTGCKVITAQRNQTLIFRTLNSSKKKATIDPTMLHRVIDNLLSNAIKFSPPNSEILITLEYTESDTLKIQVIDSGPGIPDDLKQKIFEKYEIGVIAPDVPQTGLGLAFVQIVVQAHGGNIQVQDNHPQGTIFEVTLPMQASNSDENSVWLSKGLGLRG